MAKIDNLAKSFDSSWYSVVDFEMIRRMKNHYLPTSICEASILDEFGGVILDSRVAVTEDYRPSQLMDTINFLGYDNYDFNSGISFKDLVYKLVELDGDILVWGSYDEETFRAQARRSGLTREANYVRFRDIQAELAHLLYSVSGNVGFSLKPDAYVLPLKLTYELLLPDKSFNHHQSVDDARALLDIVNLIKNTPPANRKLLVIVLLEAVRTRTIENLNKLFDKSNTEIQTQFVSQVLTKSMSLVRSTSEVAPIPYGDINNTLDRVVTYFDER